MENVEVYSLGIVSLSCCASNDLTIEEITVKINTYHPTGIDSNWKLSKDKTFASGESNPCQCEQDENRKHYLFNC